MQENEVIDEQPASSTGNDVQPDSSQAAPAEAPAQQAEQDAAVPFNQHPRWKEIMEERDYYKQLAMKAVERPVVPQSQPTAEADPYAGMTQEERQFYQRIEQIAERKAQKIAEIKDKEFQQRFEQQQAVLATVAYERFQAKHPDVLPNSPEESQIASLIRKGYDPESAYKITMFDKVKAQKEQQVVNKKVQSIQNKVAANVETSSIPANSGLPPGKTMTIRDFVEEQIRKGAV